MEKIVNVNKLVEKLKETEHGHLINGKLGYGVTLEEAITLTIESLEWENTK